MLWLWHKPAAVAPIRPLAWNFHMPWVWAQKSKKKKKKKERERERERRNTSMGEKEDGNFAKSSRPGRKDAKSPTLNT